MIALDGNFVSWHYSVLLARSCWSSLFSGRALDNV
jgi:hypothetical protein